MKSSSKIPGFPVTFEYTTSAGRSYRCSNISLPSLYPREQETVYAAGMEPGEEQILSGYLLIPTGWYRGSGTLTAMAPYCTKKADGKNVCDGEPGEGHIDKHNSASIQLLLY
ncbi:MAG: hypothetical protein GY862_06945 [Gammaproteobacteria bacterium]|nr:hypothetical protein [Gammaproteobacteria bacterium]